MTILTGHKQIRALLFPTYCTRPAHHLGNSTGRETISRSQQGNKSGWISKMGVFEYNRDYYHALQHHCTMRNDRTDDHDDDAEKDAESINILVLSVFINLLGIDLWFIVIFIVTQNVVGRSSSSSPFSLPTGRYTVLLLRLEQKFTQHIRRQIGDLLRARGTQST